MGSYMPTLADYSKVSWIQSQSLALLYRWPKFLDKRKFGSVAHKKLSSICSKISKSSGWQIDPHFSCKITWKGGSRGSKSKETFSGGPHWRIRWGGCWSEKKSPDLRSPSLGMKSYHKQLTFWAENPSISWSSLVVHGFSWLVLSLFT